MPKSSSVVKQVNSLSGNAGKGKGKPYGSERRAIHTVNESLTWSLEGRNYEICARKETDNK